MNQRFIERIPKFSKVLIVSPAFYPDISKLRALEASKKKYSGWNVRYLGLGEKFKSFVDAKMLAVQQYLELNKDMFEWALVIDSADTIFARPYIEHEFIEVLESFNKDVICGAETALYPLIQLDGLFSSKSLLKYLNSGVVAVRSSFVPQLFNYLLYLYRRFPGYSELIAKKDERGNNAPVTDQIFYQLAYFSKKVGNNMAIDEKGLISVSTKHLDWARFINNRDMLWFENIEPFPTVAPYIYHLQSGDAEWRMKEFAEKLGVFLESEVENTEGAKA